MRTSVSLGLLAFCATLAATPSAVLAQTPAQPAVPAGVPLDEAYRAEFTRCDSVDRFGPVQFPIRKTNGKVAWYGCKTDPSRLTRLERIAPQGDRPAAILWESKLAHDLDGSPKACNTPGLTDQCATTLMLKPSVRQPCPAAIPRSSHCLPVDASRIPYIVMPIAAPRGIDATAFRTKTGLAFGDLGMVLANGKQVPVIIADGGPAYKIGEGSTALLAALSDDGKPRTRAGRVVFIAFPGTSPGRDVDADALAEIIRQRAGDLFAKLTASP